MTKEEEEDRAVGAASDVGSAATTLDDELLDADAFETRVRSMYGASSSARISGNCVLDVGEHNILNFEQGNFRLVARDVETAFGATLGGRIARFLNDAGAVEDAFTIRKNAVNLKKVLLHAQVDAEEQAKCLNRLTTFYRNDMSKEDGYARCFRYREICVAAGRCKGAMLAIFDARMFTKSICCVPRMPTAMRPKRLACMPRSFVTSGFVKKGVELVSARAAKEAQVGLDVWSGGTHSTDYSPEDSTKPALTSRFDALMRRVRDELALPPHVVRFIECSLIARGAAKALVIQSELEAYRDAATRVCDAADWTIQTLRKEHRDPDAVLRDDMGCDGVTPLATEATEESLKALQSACKADRTANTLQGAAPATRETAKWIGKILDEPKRTFFAAGDCDATTSFVPDDFAISSLIASYAPTIEKYQDAMLDELAEAFDSRATLKVVDDKPWTRHVSGSQKCVRCARSYSNLWVTGKTCISCEHAARRAGTCPISSPCLPEAFCPHARRCLKCERHSCDRCGLRCGDAEDVVALVEEISADAVFLDFDRTICATKRGASPLPSFALELPLDSDRLAEAASRRAADAELLGLLTSHPNAYVVTRNSHVKEIELYLRLHGVDAPKVRHVAKGESKSSVIAQTPFTRAVFADDDARELLKSDARAIPGLRLVLFKRG